MKKYMLLVAVLLLVAVGIAVTLYVTRTSAQPATPKSVAVANGVLDGSTEGAVVVTLTKDGFVPDEIQLKKGQTITFKTTTGNLFWPASNLHPSHLLYPEFDPKGPISPTDTWNFTFEKVGAWKFHDHLSPYFTGTITVSE